MSKSTRRDFVATAAVAGVGAMTATGGVMAQTRGQQRAQEMQIDPEVLRQMRRSDALPINREARAVMPGGDLANREDILARLGLDPSTPPDAWLAIVACGSNASALRPHQLEILDRARVLNNMDNVQLPQNRQQRY
ncbi:twin-arginine translocation signal domain-containing protein [Maricaulis sp.]|jgi:hypothetical protein|uniref:twin-arginine translocation signal domain-containing protein n=1 Tax=Maricaulis sp. TaxID=1486257 RepID=UPI00260B99BC|nr:twin-arginine translocation signal domain-containing protein [Maricaulis sp.]